MNCTRLEELLSILNKNDLKSLLKFIEEKNSKESSMEFQLIDGYIKNKEFYKSNNVEQIISKFFGSKISSSEFHLIKTSLFNKIYEFIYLKSEDFNIEKLKHLNEKFSNLKLKKNYSQVLNQYSKIIKTKLLKTENFYHKYYLQKSQFNLLLDKHMYRTDKLYENNSNMFDEYYIIQKLKDWIFMSNHQDSISKKINYSFTLKNEVISYLRKNINYYKKNNLLIYIYYNILILKSEFDINNLNLLKSFLKLNFQKISKEELFEIYTEIKNIFNSSVSTNVDYYLKEILKIYEFMDKVKILAFNGGIIHIDFINVINSYLYFEEISKAENFYNKYRLKISGILKEETLSLMRAELLFSKKDYENSLNQLSRIKIPNFYFYLKIKILTLKINFELGEFNQVILNIDSFNHYLRRKKEFIISYKDFVKPFFYFLKILIRNNNMIEADRKYYIDKINMHKNIAAKKWLLNKFAS